MVDQERMMVQMYRTTVILWWDARDGSVRLLYNARTHKPANCFISMRACQHLTPLWGHSDEITHILQ